MRRTHFSDMASSTAQTLEVVGEWWSLMIVREALLGVRRFDDMARNLGIARNVLSARLSRLVEHGIFERRQYQDHPPRYEYRLTESGRALYPVLVALMEWGDRWRSGSGREPLVLVHRTCGHETHPRFVCDHCGAPVVPYDTTPRPGPGARADIDERYPWMARLSPPTEPSTPS